MAKIDVTTIEGFDKMTDEEKIKALTDFEYDDNLKELERYKNACTKANGEAAEWKKKYQETLSAEDKNKQEQAEELEKMKTRLVELEKEKTNSEYVSKFVGLGYPSELAGEMATALMENNVDKVVEIQKKFNTTRETEIKQSVLKHTPTPPNGSNSGEITTLKDFRAMSRGDRIKFANEHPEEYKKLYEGETN